MLMSATGKWSFSASAKMALRRSPSGMGVNFKYNGMISRGDNQDMIKPNRLTANHAHSAAS